MEFYSLFLAMTLSRLGFNVCSVTHLLFLFIWIERLLFIRLCYIGSQLDTLDHLTKSQTKYEADLERKENMTNITRFNL